VGRAAQDGRTLSDYNIGAHDAQANERRAALFRSLGAVQLSTVHLAPCCSLQFTWRRAALSSSRGAVQLSSVHSAPCTSLLPRPVLRTRRASSGLRLSRRCRRAAPRLPS
jgi:hypothetical protein